jgi:hypothetical protein
LGNMKRSRILVGIVALAVILTALFFVLTRHTPKPLTYQGKPIEYWFARLPVTPVPPPGVDLGNVRGFIESMGQRYGSTNLVDAAGLDAITEFGTNALPLLLARLQGADSVIEKAVTRAATNTGVGYLPFRNADLERLQAVTGLIHVKTLTPQARELITSLRTNPNRDIASAAAYILTRRAALGEPLALILERKAEPAGPADGSQPIRSETNQTPSAAGSRR